MSCPTTSFCMAIDADRDYLYRRGTWSRAHLNPFSNVASAISCRSAAFCAGVGGFHPGTAQTYDGRRWTKPLHLDPASYFVDVSCATTRFCVAIDGRGKRFIYNGPRWGHGRVVANAGSPLTISCPSSSFCAIGDWHGHVITYNGHTWSAPVSLHSHLIEAVSCSSASFCAALDQTGNAMIGSRRR